MRIKTFGMTVKVNGSLLRQEPRLADEVRRMLASKAARELRGPRGGRYLPISEPYDFREGITDDDFIRNERSVAARVDARYARPSQR